MSTIYGAIGLQDTDRVFGNADYQQQFFEETERIFDLHNKDVEASTSLFVDETTTVAQRRYRLIGGGMMQNRGGQAQSLAVKAKGYWDVAFPIYEFGDQIAGDRVALAYMSVAEYRAHTLTVMKRHASTVRYSILKRLLNKAAETFVDNLYGSLTVYPLANGDATTYPPVIGSDAEATASHYIGANFLSAAIDDTSNPYALIVAKLEAQFGAVSGGSNIITFINPAETTVSRTELTDWVDVSDSYVMLGDNERKLMNFPDLPGTARLIGRTNGTWVAEWLYMPANYMLGIHLDAPKPLIRRVDPAETGLSSGLAIVSRDSKYPFEQAHYEARFGYGAGNRLAAVALHLVASTTYDTPAAYA